MWRSSCFTLYFLSLSLFSVTVDVNGQSDILVNRLKSQVIALDSIDLAGESNVRAMRKALDSDFQVLGIGEQSHGTSEFFTARLLVIKALADDPTFTKIGLEAPMAEVEKLNDYFREGQGDLKEILRSFRLYGYECAEFVDLVENVGRLAKVRGKAIRFFGFDMQSPFQSLKNLRDSGVAGDVADSLKTLLQSYEQLSNEIYGHMFSEADFAELKASSDRVLGKLEAAVRTNASLQKNVNNYRQFLMLNDPVHAYEQDIQSIIRDSLMAENVLAEIEPGAKMIILAHNAHLQRTTNIFSKSVGTFLSWKLGAAYQCVAQTTSYGFYTTFTPEAGRITDKNKVFAGDGSTWEYHFSQSDQPVFLFKTAVLKPKVQGAHLPGRYRQLVYGLSDKQFFDGNILDDFDYVLHIRQTSGNHSFYLR